LTLRKLEEFLDRANAGGRKSFRYEELDEEFFIPHKHDGLVPYLIALQKDLEER